MKYIKFFKPWKIIVFVIFIISVPGCLFVKNPYGIGNAIISSVICLAVAVIPLLSDILYIKTPANKLWERWKNVDGIKADQRKERALMGELTPIDTYADLKYGIFSGSNGGTYKTTLRRCSCPDFQKRKVPCKHMYYLAAKCNAEFFEGK